MTPPTPVGEANFDAVTETNNPATLPHHDFFDVIEKFWQNI
jgi:hypothetical protein